MSTTTPQPTEIPFAPIKEKLRESIEQYKKNHPEKHREYEEFKKFFDALKSKKILDPKNIDEMFNHRGNLDLDWQRDQILNILLKHYDPTLSNWLVTWLHLAVLLESKEVVQFILDCGANPNVKDSNGDTPLHYCGYTVNPNAQNSNGYTPLHYCGYTVNPNAQNSNGYTPLHYCVNYGHLEIAQMLVKSGADINARNDYGLTAIDKARISHPELAEYLSSIKDGLPQDHSLIEEKSATHSALVQENSESSETAKVEDESPKDQAGAQEESATSSSVPGTTPPAQESKSNDDGFIGPIFKWLRLPPISGEEEAEIIPFDTNVDKGEVVEVHYVVMPGQGAFAESSDN